MYMEEYFYTYERWLILKNSANKPKYEVWRIRYVTDSDMHVEYIEVGTKWLLLCRQFFKCIFLI